MKRIFIVQLIILFMYTGFALANDPLLPPPQEHVLQFDGYNIAVAPNIAQLNLCGIFTMEVWVYVKSYQPYTVLMGKPHDPRGSDPYMNYVLDIGPDGKFNFVQTTGQPGSYSSVTSPSMVVLEKWTHVAGVLSDDTMILYVDGIAVATGQSPGTPGQPNVAFSLGGGVDASGLISTSGFKGLLRQARVWNTALSAQEIQMYAAQAISGNEPGLIVCWPLDDGSGSIARSIGPVSADLSLGDANSVNKPVWVSSLLQQELFTSIDFQLPVNEYSPQDIIPFDYDGDGDLDFLVTYLLWPPPEDANVAVTVMNNSGTGSFTAVQDVWVDTIQFEHPRHWGIDDFNNDGRMDIVIVDHGKDVSPFPGGQSKIILRTSDGVMINETSTRFPNVQAFTHNVAVGDINNDGHSDIYMCNIWGEDNIGPRFYMNNGTGNFTEDTSRIPVEITNLQKKYTASQLTDVDNDCDLDLILGGDDGVSDALLVNNGSGFFSYAPVNSLPISAIGPTAAVVGITAQDFNNDGWIDLLMSVNSEYRITTLQLLINQQNNTFIDQSENIPQSWPISENFGDSWIRWTLPADFNDDGNMDFIAVGQNESPARVFLNMGNAVFTDISDRIQLGSNISTCGTGDFNGDGMTDIIVARRDKSVTLLINCFYASLAETVKVLKIHSGISMEDVSGLNDLNNDGKIGFTELFFHLRKAAEQ